MRRGRRRGRHDRERIGVGWLSLSCFVSRIIERVVYRDHHLRFDLVFRFRGIVRRERLRWPKRPHGRCRIDRLESRLRRLDAILHHLLCTGRIRKPTRKLVQLLLSVAGHRGKGRLRRGRR